MIKDLVMMIGKMHSHKNIIRIFEIEVGKPFEEGCEEEGCEFDL